MATLKIFNGIQTENEKNAARYWGDAEGVCFKDIDEFCESINPDDNKVDIQIHCDGGNVTEGWAIYDRLRALSGKEITCTVVGNAASMATVILMAAPKERRKAYRDAHFLVHNPYICAWGLDDTMTADQLQQKADDLRAEQDKILNLYVERCGCDRAEMQALMNENKYIDCDRAMEMGLIGSTIVPATAKANKQINNVINHQNSKAMAEKKIEVKQSLLDKMLCKLGLKSMDDAAKSLLGMDLNTADGQTLTVEREEGAPQVGDKATPDGTFEMPDGSKITVKDGVITEITPASGSDGTDDDAKKGDGSGGDGDGDNGGSDDDKDKKIADLQAQVDELTKENEQLKEQLAASKDKAKELSRVYNAVQMAGGEKALSKLSSNYHPKPRNVDGDHAKDKDPNDWAAATAAAKEEMRKKYGKKE